MPRSSPGAHLELRCQPSWLSGMPCRHARSDPGCLRSELWFFDWFFDIVKRKLNVVFASFVRFAAVSPAADPEGSRPCASGGWAWAVDGGHRFEALRPPALTSAGGCLRGFEAVFFAVGSGAWHRGPVRAGIWRELEQTAGRRLSKTSDTDRDHAVRLTLHGSGVLTVRRFAATGEDMGGMEDVHARVICQEGFGPPFPACGSRVGSSV